MIRSLGVLLAIALLTATHAAHGIQDNPADAVTNARQQLIKIPVRVVDVEGEPVVGATVTPWALRTSQGHGSRRKGGYGDSEPMPVTTDQRGLAVVEYPKYGILDERVQTTQVTLSVDHRDFAYVSHNDVNVPREETGPHEVELQRGGTLQLQPMLDGKPAPFDGLAAVWSDGRAYSPTAAQAEEMDGALRVPPMPAGERQAMLLKKQNERVTHFTSILDFKLADGDVVSEQVELQPAVRVVGRLSDNVPRPVRNGRVVVYTLPGPYDRATKTNVSWFTWAKVDGDGAFVVDAWPRGESLQLIALCDGYMATSGLAPEEVENPRDPGKDPFNRPQVFRPDELADTIEVEMTALARCRFQAVNEQGQPIANVEVRSWPNVGWWNYGSQIYCSSLVRGERLIEVRDYTKAADDDFPPPFVTTTDDEGRGEMLLPAGREYLVAEHDGYELPVIRGSREVRVMLVDGEPIDVLLVLQPKGREYLGEWDKLAGVLFGCTGEECRRLLEDDGFRKRMERVRQLYDDADDVKDPKMLGSVYEQIAAAFEELNAEDSDDEVQRWRRKAAEQAEKLE